MTPSEMECDSATSGQARKDFSLVRPNSHKENLSPWQISERLAARAPLQLCLLPPVFLDYYLNDSGGYDVPRLPQRGKIYGIQCWRKAARIAIFR